MERETRATIGSDVVARVAGGFASAEEKVVPQSFVIDGLHGAFPGYGLTVWIHGSCLGRSDCGLACGERGRRQGGSLATYEDIIHDNLDLSNESL